MKEKHQYDGAGYLESAYILTHRKIVVKTFVNLIKKSGLVFDTIAFRGISGALIAPSVSDALKIPFLLVRKSGDGNHSSRNFEGHSKVGKFIIIDDLISSGKTIRTIVDKIHNVEGEVDPFTVRKIGWPDAECVGIFLYNQTMGMENFEYGGKKIPIYSFMGRDSFKDSKYRIIYTSEQARLLTKI